MLTGFAVELRRSRMLWWGLLVSLASTAMALSSTSRWMDSLSQASIWASLPTIYFGALVVAGAADCEYARRLTSLPLIGRCSGRPLWQTAGAPFAAILTYGAILPSILPSLIVIGAAQFGAKYGELSPEYIALNTVLLIGGCALGVTIGALAQSRIATLILGVLLGLLYSLFGSPIPPAKREWLMVSHDSVTVLVVIVVTLVFSACAVTFLARYRVRAFGRILGASSAAIALVGTWISAGEPKQVERVSPDAGICDESAAYTVCVWPGDQHYLPRLAEFAERLRVLNEHLDGERNMVITEPGLNVPDPRIAIRPLGGGDGMWLAAEEMAYGLANALPPAGCSPEHSPNTADSYVTSRAALEAMTNFIFGSQRGASIQSTDPRDEEIRELAEKAWQLPEDQQLDWIKSTWNSGREC